MDNRQIIQLISTCPTLTEAFRKQVSIHCSTVTNPQVIPCEKKHFSLWGEGNLSFNQKREKRKKKKITFLQHQQPQKPLLHTDQELSLAHTNASEKISVAFWNVTSISRWISHQKLQVFKQGLWVRLYCLHYKKRKQMITIWSWRQRIKYFFRWTDIYCPEE